jgi:hypothetical protein
VNRHLVTLVAGLLAIGFGGRAGADEPDANRPEDPASAWAYSASIYLYLVPHDDDYAQPTLTADRRWLHLEARYNYEDFETASAWLGYNIGIGSDVSFAFTPKMGIVFGHMTGIAPGYNAFLEWKQLTLYSEGEYVFDDGNNEDSFFYSWSELTVTAKDRLLAGLALQRTQVYETPREFQWGVLLGASFRGVAIGGYVFDPDHEDRTYVISVSADSD